MLQRRTFTVGAAALVAAPMLRAQTLPKGPVRIVVGFAPGGGTDILARVVGQKLTDMWKTSVVVENKAGASGVIAADYVAKLPGDGSTIMMAHINSHAIAPALFPKMNYDPNNDFAPICLIGVTPNLLIGNERQASRTVKALVEECRANPGKISFGSAGAGSAQHLALEMFKLQAKVQALHIPYKGSGPMLTDLIGGQINYSFDTMTAATPHVKAGKAIAIAQTRLKRAESHHSVPTMDESGFPGYEATTWYGLAGPRSMSPGLVKRMNEDVNRVLQMPDVIAKFDQYGAEDGGGSAEKFGEFMKAEGIKWARVVKEANVKMDA